MGLGIWPRFAPTTPPSSPLSSHNNNVNHGNRDYQTPCSIPKLLLTLFAFTILAQAAFSAAQTNHVRKLLRGVVTAGEGQAVAGATIELFDRSGVQIVSSVTDASGRFEIVTDAAAGEYELVITNSGQLNDQHIRLGETAVDIKFAVSRAPQQGNSLSGYTVSARQLGIPSKVRLRISAAQKQFDRGNIADAMKEIDFALRAAPSCSEAWSMQALMKLAAGDPAGAIQDASRAADIDPNNSAAYLAAGSAYNSRKDFEKAEIALRHALELRPDSWQTQLEIAKTWYGEKRFVLALRQLELIGQEFPDVHLVRANVLMNLDRNRDGAEEFRVFLHEVPGDRRAPQIREIVSATEHSASRGISNTN